MTSCALEEEKEKKVALSGYGGPHLLVAALTLCAKQKNLHEGSKLHGEILQKNAYRSNIIIGNAVINMYAKCGALEQAKRVFDDLPFQDVVSWNALVSGYAQHGHGEKVIKLLHQMQQEALFPDEVTFACVLKACARLKAIQKGKEIHSVIVNNVLFGSNVVLDNALLDMYAKCGAIEEARRIFDEICVRDVVTWNALIAGQCQHEEYGKACKCFERMKEEAFSPDAVTFSSVLKACGSLGMQKKGAEIHAEISTTGFLEESTVLGNALINMYAKCGAFKRAELFLCKMSGRDAVSWNALIAGYCLHGQPEEALHCFESMKEEGLLPDEMTLGSLVNACSSLGLCLKGMEIHSEIARRRDLLTGSIVGNALVDMYVKCNEIGKAQEVFKELPFHDIVSWTSLIAGYSQLGLAEEALKCYTKMRCEGISPDHVTFACILKACSITGAVENGEDIHSEIARMDLLGKEVILGGALVDMYANCGSIEMAREVFDELPVHNIVSYSALIAGLSEHGYGEEAHHYFEKMIGKSLVPDEVTFGCLLKACGSIGATGQGQRCFEFMNSCYGMVPSSEHYTSMIDLFGGTGHLEKAMETIKKMPSSDHLPAWCAFMGACQQLGNVYFGRQAFENATRIDERSAVAYLLMGYLYTGGGSLQRLKSSCNGTTSFGVDAFASQF